MSPHTTARIVRRLCRRCLDAPPRRTASLAAAGLVLALSPLWWPDAGAGRPAGMPEAAPQPVDRAAVPEVFPLLETPRKSWAFGKEAVPRPRPRRRIAELAPQPVPQLVASSRAATPQELPEAVPLLMPPPVRRPSVPAWSADALAGPEIALVPLSAPQGAAPLERPLTARRVPSRAAAPARAAAASAAGGAPAASEPERKPQRLEPSFAGRAVTSQDLRSAAALGRLPSLFGKPTIAVGDGAGLPPSRGPLDVVAAIDLEDLDPFAEGIRVGQAGVLGGSGAVAGALVNRGVVSPGHSPGFLEIAGDYVQGADAALDIELAGTAAADFDRLLVAGIASLAGSVRVILLDDFTPQAGDRFDVLVAAQIGLLDVHFELPELAGGLALFVELVDLGTATALRISAGPGSHAAQLPEPASATLLGLAACGLLATRRRRLAGVLRFTAGG